MSHNKDDKEFEAYDKFIEEQRELLERHLFSEINDHCVDQESTLDYCVFIKQHFECAVFGYLLREKHDNNTILKLFLRSQPALNCLLEYLVQLKNEYGE